MLSTDYTIRENIHNQPSGSQMPSDADMQFAKHLNKKFGDDLPIKIYTAEDGYQRYNQYGPTMDPLEVTPDEN